MMRNLGAVYSLQERNQEAITILKKASNIIKVNAINQPELTAQIINTLGIAYFRQHKLSKAESLLTLALQTNSATGTSELKLAENLNNLAKIYVEQHKFQKADQAYQRSLEISERLLGPVHPDVALTRANLGLLYMEMRMFEDAQKQYLLSLAITEQQDPIVSARVVRTLYLLSGSYVQADKKEEAERVLTRAVEIVRNDPLIDSETLVVLEAYSDLLESTGNLEAARVVHAEAKRARAEMALTVRIKNQN
jgi:tetratricopeptide (TPR) repeat protein